MRATLEFVGLVALAMLAGAVLGYPVQQLLSSAHDFGFDSIAHRLFELVLIALVIVWIRRKSLGTKQDYGYGLPTRRFMRVAGWAGLAGIASATLGAGFLIAFGLRVVRPEFVLSLPGALKLLATGLASGIAVPLLEDTFMRGIVHTAIGQRPLRRQSSLRYCMCWARATSLRMR
jgi:membrane protease YdiL (CAAX protease family)